MKFISSSEMETKKFAENFASELHGGEILALQGELGAGKTTFVKGLAEGLKIKQTIHSPTFVLMRIFKIPKSRAASREPRVKTLAHIDAYRLNSSAEFSNIGAMDYLGDPNTLTVIEWPEKVKNLLKNFKNIVWVNFTYGKEENERIIKIKKLPN